MDLPDSGDVAFIDDYGTSYATSWQSTDLNGTRLIDFTTVITTPYVWGQPITGKVVNKQVIRDGMCDVLRRVFAIRDDGYEIVAEGSLLQLCEVPLVFPREDAVSPFQHDLNNELTSQTELAYSSGPRFTDPAVGSDVCWFGEIGGGTDEVFEFVDVWGN